MIKNQTDLLKAIAKDQGFQVNLRPLGFDTSIQAVQSGQVAGMIAGMSITDERKQSFDFSDPYYYASIICLVNEGSEYENAQGVSDLAGATCTSQLGTIWYDVCLPQIPDANILPAQESAPAMLVALNSGRVDVVCTDMPTGTAALVAYPNMRLLDFAGSDDDFQVSQEEINIGISVRKGNTELLDKINSVLATLTVDDFNRMMDEAIAVQPLAQ